MRLDAMKKQGKRTDLTSRPLDTKSRADERLGDQMGESARTIQRYIRLRLIGLESLIMFTGRVSQFF